MSFNHTLSAVLRSAWLIEERYANAHLPIIIGLLDGTVKGEVFRDGSAEFEIPFVVDAKGRNKTDLFGRNRFGQLLTNRLNPDIAPGSIAVFPLNGPLKSLMAPAVSPVHS